MEKTDIQPDALLLDDGELDDVWALLEELRVECLRPEKEAASRAPLPTSLLVTTPRHALARTRRGLEPGATASLVHVVVVPEGSRRLEAVLERSGCDFVVRRPVHPEALRLLILNAVYRGAEKRKMDRVAIGAAVTLRRRGGAREATLVDLSPSGCRLIAEAVEPGEKLSVMLPAALTGGGELALAGRVVRTEATPSGGAKERSVGVGFDALSAPARRGLRAVLLRHANAKLKRAAKPDAAAATPASRPEGWPAEHGERPERAEPGERRRNPRKRYTRVLLARSERASAVLIGRDLSIAGMRVEPDPDLELGDRLKLVLYGQVGIKPILVEAVVARDDGPEGCFLEFSKSPRRLGQLVDSLLILGPRRPGSGERPQLVVSECVGADAGETPEG